MRVLRLPSPTTVIALVALFFALGGSAFAVGQRVAANQQRCAAGAVRGVAVVIGEPLKGLGNMSSSFVSTPSLFARRFNCTGKGVEVRRVSTGTFDVRFVGNAANVAVGNSAVDGAVSVTRNQDGSFRVTVYSTQADQNLAKHIDNPFQLVAV